MFDQELASLPYKIMMSDGLFQLKNTANSVWSSNDESTCHVIEINDWACTVLLRNHRRCIACCLHTDLYL